MVQLRAASRVFGGVTARLRGARTNTPQAWSIALAVVIAGGAIIRLHFGLHEQEIYWPDETYASVEQAHRVVYGYGIVPWEFVGGLRSWAFPGLLTAVLWASRIAGVGMCGRRRPRRSAALRAAGRAADVRGPWGVRVCGGQGEGERLG